MLFLDDGFSAESVAVRLRTAGFTVQRFPEWFQDESGHKKQNVKDPEIIRFCHNTGWLLVTKDHEMRNLHAEELLKSEIAVLATANNNDDDSEWIAAIINLKAKILREFKNRDRPWFATFSKAATMEIRPIRPKTKRG